MENRDILVYIAVIVAISISITFGLMSITQTGHSDDRFDAAIKAQSQEDKCTPPPGYSQADWEEHMGHHPDMYEECLNTNQKTYQGIVGE